MQQYIIVQYSLGQIRNGNTIKNTAKILDIDRRTGSEWLRKYNENGVEGLIPHFNKCGRKCLLSDEQLKQLEFEVVEKRNIRSIKDAQKYIYSNFHINYSNLFRTFYKPGMDNILDRTGQKFGISVTGIMGVNCSSYMEIYERNNSFTTILTLTMFRILNMVDKKGKEILKKIVVNPTLDREHIKKELSKNIKSKSEKLKEIEIEQSKNRKNKETTFNKIKQICNTTPKITQQKISITQRITIKESLIDSSVENILNNEKEILLILDNAKIHHAEDVKIASKILNIELMYLPEYSPDLQPIKDLWKIIKSVTYLKDYENLDELIWIVTEEFYNHVSSSSLYGGWIDEFMRN